MKTSSSASSTAIFWPMNFSIASRARALDSSTRLIALPPAACARGAADPVHVVFGVLRAGPS